MTGDGKAAGGDREATYRRLRAEAASRWGETRAAAIEATLRRTADAVWRLDQLDFQNDERPAFYLADLSVVRAEGA